jgi:hypothetical protein
MPFDTIATPWYPKTALSVSLIMLASELGIFFFLDSQKLF